MFILGNDKNKRKVWPDGLRPPRASSSFPRRRGIHLAFCYPACVTPVTRVNLTGKTTIYFESEPLRTPFQGCNVVSGLAPYDCVSPLVCVGLVALLPLPLLILFWLMGRRKRHDNAGRPLHCAWLRDPGISVCLEMAVLRASWHRYGWEAVTTRLLA